MCVLVMLDWLEEDAAGQVVQEADWKCLQSVNWASAGHHSIDFSCIPFYHLQVDGHLL